MAEYKDVTLIMQEIEQGKHNLKFKNAEYAEVFASALAFVQGVIDRVPVANVAEFVRCKDCKHYRKHPNSPNGLCYAHTQPYDDEQILRGLQVVRIIMKPDGFCSYGERKEIENVKP